MPIWRVASVKEEPEIILVEWLVMEVCSVHRPQKTRHFVGYNVTDQEGRVSSQIVEFDSNRMIGVTRSGRLYQLRGEPGNGSSDGMYVWHRWCLINKISESTVVTEQILLAGVSAL